MAPSSPRRVRLCEKCGTEIEKRKRYCYDCLSPAAKERYRRAPSKSIVEARGARAEKRARLAEGAGPLSDEKWRKNALSAVETWEIFGREEWTREQWIGALRKGESGPAAERDFERKKEAWSEMGIDLEHHRGNCYYRFTPEGIDRVLLIRDLLDRYLAHHSPEDLCNTTTERVDSDTALSASPIDPAAAEGATAGGAGRDSGTSVPPSEPVSGEP